MPYTNFPLLPAPLSILAFLGTAGVAVALVAGAGVAALAGRSPLARKLFAAAGVLLAAYGVLLLALGAAARGEAVPRGAEKVFCEIDCHLGYAVAAVREDPDGASRRVTVTVRTRFDERTVSPRRGGGPLSPNPRAAALVDGSGRRFEADRAGVAALLAPLRPGASYATDLVFHVPPDAGTLRLSLVESEGPVRVLLGHERAPFAGETLLALK